MGGELNSPLRTLLWRQSGCVLRPGQQLCGKLDRSVEQSPYNEARVRVGSAGQSREATVSPNPKWTDFWPVKS